MVFHSSMRSIEKRCYGKFEFIAEFVVIDVERIAEIFCKMKFVPFRVEHNFMGNYFVYEGWSPLFKEVVLGDVIPMYRVVLTQKSARAELEVNVEEIQ